MKQDLPDGWSSVELADVVDVLDFERQPINATERSERTQGKALAALFAYYGATGQVGWIDQFRTEGQRVLLGEDAAPFFDPNKDKAYLANGHYWVNNHAHVLQGVIGALNNIFLCHQLNTVDFHPFVSGSTRLKLTSAAMKRIPLAVAPLREQTRIVDKLEELLSDLDAGVAELMAAQKKLAQYRQSLLKAAVEGRLTEAWRAQRGPEADSEESGAQLLARILRERRARWEAKQLAKFEAQGKAPGSGWQEKYEEPATIDAKALPDLPEGWMWACAEQLCDFITKGTTPPKGLDVGSTKTVPFLRVTNLTADGTLNLDDKVFVSEYIHRSFLARSVVYPGDVLMNIVGPPLGQVSVVPPSFAEWNINQAIAIFRAVGGVSSQFMALCLLSAPLQAWLAKKAKTTAGQTNLTLEVCRNLPIALPPKSEQREIAQTIEAALAGVMSQSVAIAMAFRQSAAQRKNILQSAFSGQLVPQDPNDEPASVLLARIRAKRAAQSQAGGSSRRPRRVASE